MKERTTLVLVWERRWNEAEGGRVNMTELCRVFGKLTQPPGERLLDRIRTRPIAGADETRLPIQNDGTGKPKNGFV